MMLIFSCIDLKRGPHYNNLPIYNSLMSFNTK